MKRNIIYKMIDWKTKYKDSIENFNPLLITGLKSVGKTYLAYDFSKIFFNYIYYFNFELDMKKSSVFSLKTQNLSNEIFNLFKYEDDIHKKERILILDEFHYLNHYEEIIKKLYKENEFPYIILISSNESFTNSLTIDKHSIKINPFSFDEFLSALGEEWYIETIKTHFNNNKSLPSIVHKELIKLYNLFIQIGGFPQAINEYINLSSVINVSSIHKTIDNKLITCYNNDFANINNESLKLNQVYNSIYKQLFKDNKKFKYNLIRKGTTYNYFKDAINYLTKNRYLLYSKKINSASNKNDFKLYLSDVGILNTQYISSNDFFNIDNNLYKKSILENYIGQCLFNNGYDLYFWESNSIAKIDFIIKDRQSDKYIPIEIFTNNYTRTKSVSIFKKDYNIDYSIKISTNNFSFKNNVKHIPLYAAFCI